MPTTAHPHVYLAPADWLARRAAHEQRVRAWTDPHQVRAARGEKHPVYDFLFSYYAFRPAWLRRWHPGPDVILAGEAARRLMGDAPCPVIIPQQPNGEGVAVGWWQ